MEKETQKDKKKEQTSVDAKKNVFHFDELKQSDQKMSTNKYINPHFNPGCLSRVKSNTNGTRKYSVEKELYYMRDHKKVFISKGEMVNFVV